VTKEAEGTVFNIIPNCSKLLMVYRFGFVYIKTDFILRCTPTESIQKYMPPENEIAVLLTAAIGKHRPSEVLLSTALKQNVA
jgi:hypothetical protein